MRIWGDFAIGIAGRNTRLDPSPADFGFSRSRVARQKNARNTASTMTTVAITAGSTIGGMIHWRIGALHLIDGGSAIMSLSRQRPRVAAGGSPSLSV